MSPEQYARRFAAETKTLARAYCDSFGLWRACRFKPCRRARACAGERTDCLKRGLPSVPREAQWQVRQRLLRALPAKAGPPERTARSCLPGALCELQARRQRTAGGA